MNSSYIIKNAVLSEKAYAQMEKGVYTFLVDSRATKGEIKNVIEKQFSTTVVRVNVMNKSAKNRRITGTRKQVLTGQGRKAIVYLKAGERIAMLSPKKETEKKTSKASKESNQTETGKTKGKGLLSRIKAKTENKNKEEGK